MDSKKNNQKILAIMGIYVVVALAMFVIVGATRDGIGAAVNGWLNVLQMPAQMTLDYFKHATVAGTFLNVAAVGAGCMAVFAISGADLSGVSLMAYFLTIGFAFFGMNFVNIWPCMLGTLVFTLVTKQPFKKQVNMAVFATGCAPFVSEMLFRYEPLAGTSIVVRLIAALAVGIFIGFLLPIICGHTPNMHKGYTLYNAASGIFFIAIFLYSLLFKAVGVDGPTNTDLGESLPIFVNTYAIATGVLTLIAGFVWNGNSFNGYKEILGSTGYKTDFTKPSVGLAAINIAVFELFMTAYYNVIGSNMTGPTLAAIICMLSVAASGTHVLNMIPLIIGYAIACSFCTFTVTTQAIILGLCYCSAISPIAGCFGPIVGIAAGMIHAIMVTQVVTFHNAFSFYNGGITCALVAMFMIPVLEYFFEPDKKFRLNPIPIIKKK